MINVRIKHAGTGQTIQRNLNTSSACNLLTEAFIRFEGLDKSVARKAALSSIQRVSEGFPYTLTHPDTLNTLVFTEVGCNEQRNTKDYR